MNKTVLAILAISMLAMPLMPSATADPCTVPSNDSAGYPTCEMKLATGPGGVTIKGFIGLGIGVCFLDPTFPVAPCAPNPGGVSSLGAAFFFVDNHPQSVGDWNTHPGNVAGTVGRDVRIWVQWLQGLDLEGFDVTACTDGDDDDVCSGSNPLDAQVTGNSWTDPNTDCSNDPDKKDKKHCDDGDDAEVHFCAMKDNYNFLIINDDGTIANGHDGDFDDVVVFIGVWLDESFAFPNKGDELAFGLDVGDFAVYAEYGAFLNAADCTLENTDDWDQVPTTGDGPS